MSGKGSGFKQGGDPGKPGSTPSQPSSQGRGRGIPPTIGMADEILQRQMRQRVQKQGAPSASEFHGPSGTQGESSKTSVPILDVGESSSSGSSSPSSGEKTIRGRGGFKAVELHTIPEGVTSVKSGKDAKGQQIVCMTNCIKIEPMKNKVIYQYRVDFKPEIESVKLRRTLFDTVKKTLFATSCVFDGYSDAKCATKLPDKVTNIEVEDPVDKNKRCNLVIKNVGIITGTSELLRNYNIHMKEFLRKNLGFYQVNLQGAYVHPALAIPVGQTGIQAVRGYRTSANLHENNQTLMTLESVHKLVQNNNILQYMEEICKNCRGDLQKTIKEKLIGKLAITGYNKLVYKVEDVDFTKNPLSTFFDRRANKDITYKQYFDNHYHAEIKDVKQPLLLVVPNNKRRREGDDQTEIYLVPELCNIAGLTNEQRNDNRLKNELVRVSQIPPNDRVQQLKTFLQKLNSNQDIQAVLDNWGYSYGKDPLEVPARIFPTEQVALGRQSDSLPQKWPTVDSKTANFDNLIMRDQCVKRPNIANLKIIIGISDKNNESRVLDTIKTGFAKVGLGPPQHHETIRLQQDRAENFTQAIRKLPTDTTLALVIIPNQNQKDKYDAVKKVATNELGIITQVVTSRLMMDDRKAGGAAVKIGVQVVAKLGGEPWWINLPLRASMVCGYDTYHDTAQRGRSFGAFVASMNSKYSRWWSKADMHDRMDELSAHITENLVQAINQYRQKNENKEPDRIFIYRDGVSDGQLEHVVKIELKQIIAALKGISDKIRLCFIIVNKRIGARFYWRNGPNVFNPSPGTVIDDVVTRRERYDFYLISQSTRQGTVAPTYYNIIHDDTGLEPERHQQMAYKMCFNYYNWSGTVRVPSPCQYAHKLALLCGEHLHNVPNASLDDKLHFL